MRTHLVYATALALTACSAVNPVMLARLATADPMSADPGKFAARLHPPEGLAVPPGGAVPRSGMWRVHGTARKPGT